MDRQALRLISFSTMLAAVMVLVVTCGRPDVGSRRAGAPAPDFVGALPLPANDITENVGQVENGDVLHYVSAGGMKVGFANGSVLLRVLEPVARTMESSGITTERKDEDVPNTRRGVLVRVSFDGSNPVMPEGREEMPYLSHYFLGNDPAAWQTGVRSHRELVYPDLYDGIDLVYRAAAEGLKYEFRVRPGADPGKIILSYEGLESLDLDGEGNLMLRTEVGDLLDGAPSAYDERGTEVGCRFVLRGPLSVGFDLVGWDGSEPLVIDPLVYSTFLGGAESDDGFSIAADASGNAYVAGTTTSGDFPATAGAFDTSLGSTEDAFVMKMSPDGSGLIYATYLGGGRDTDQGNGIALGDAGVAYVTGRTRSNDFPTTSGAFDETANGRTDVFVTKLSADGSDLIYSTLVGGRGSDRAEEIALGADGSAFVTGRTQSSGFPVTLGAFDETINSSRDAFVMKVSPDGSGLDYSTFLGGSRNDDARSIALDADGNAYVTGETSSDDFPVSVGALDTALGGSRDAYVTKLSADGSAIVYSTYLGGSRDERGTGVVVGPGGNAYATGRTNSGNFPVTAGAFNETLNGGQDAFVAKLGPAGDSLAYATFLGGARTDEAKGIALLGPEAYVTGRTASSDFPSTPGAPDETHNGSTDVFVAGLNASGSALVFGTFLGGSRQDEARALAIAFVDSDSDEDSESDSGSDTDTDTDTDSEGSAYVTGFTTSADFPVTLNVFDESFNGDRDAFVARMLLPAIADDSDTDTDSDSGTDTDSDS